MPSSFLLQNGNHLFRVNNDSKLSWSQAQSDIILEFKNPDRKLYTIVVYDESLSPSLTHYLAQNIVVAGGSLNLSKPVKGECRVTLHATQPTSW